MPKELKLITINENNFPVFNPEAKLIKQFNALIRRDRGSPGDHDGREKRLATKELAFVHYRAYHNSEFVLNYPEEELEDRIKRAIDLPDDWKPDKLIEDAIKTYRDIVSNTPSVQSLNEIRASLFSAMSIVKILRRRMENNLRLLEQRIQEAEEDQVVNQISELLDKAFTDFNKIIEMATKIPIQMKAVEGLVEAVNRENEEKKVGRKNKIVNDQELME